MKQTSNLIFCGGVLALRQSGHGDKNGTGYFQFDETDMDWQPHDESDGSYIRIELPRSELIELRDYLNEQVKD